MHNTATTVQAFQGIDQLLLVSTSDMQDRAQQHRNTIDAARAAGVRHVFYTGSDIRAQPSPAIMPVIAPHRATEQHLKESGLAYTIFQNILYTDTLPGFIGPQAIETGVWFPAGTGRVAFATRQDMAEAIAQVLTTPGHEGQTYAQAGTESYSFAEVAAILSELAGRPVAYTDAPPAAFAAQLAQVGVPAPVVGMLNVFGEAIAQGDFDRPSPTLAGLLGRPLTSLRDYLQSAYFTA